MFGETGFRIFLTVALYLMALEGLSWLTAPGLGPCIVEQEQGAKSEAKADKKNCATFAVGTWVVTKRVIRVLKTHDNDKAVVAAFTIILGISTIGLWIATYRLWQVTNETLDHAEDSSERQLRAYIWTEIIPVEFNRPNFYVTCKFRNSGQTPAYKVHLWAQAIPVAEPPPFNFRFADPPAIVDNPRFVINPTSQHFSTLEIEGIAGPITVSEKMAIQEGYLTVYMWGEVRYEDAFGNNRTTKFRQRIEPIVSGMSAGWVYCEEGNEAD